MRNQRLEQHTGMTVVDTYSKACFINLGQSRIEPVRSRAYTKSNGSLKVQSDSRSSTRNSTLGGTLFLGQHLHIVTAYSQILQGGLDGTEINTDNLSHVSLWSLPKVLSVAAYLGPGVLIGYHVMYVSACQPMCLFTVSGPGTHTKVH